MDRRTSCLQSNVEFLQQTINKNTLDAQQKLAAANKEITAKSGPSGYRICPASLSHSAAISRRLPRNS